jgi:copper(I)-binding protein
MKIPSALRQPLQRAVVAGLAAFALATAGAHDYSVGAVEITHPFATPSLPGATIGAAYVATLENNGAQPDKLIHAATPVAASVEMHSMAVDAQGVMHMREVEGIVIAPKAALKMRPGMGYHMMLVGLKKPLKEGDTFAMTLQFERAGKVEVKVYVQTPRAQGMADMASMPAH